MATTPRPPTQREVNRRIDVDAWNAAHPVGTRVRYWPVLPPLPNTPPREISRAAAEGGEQ